MEALHQIISFDFLLRNSVYTSVLIGFICPILGVFLVLRRLVFMGVALPQISSTGVAVALSLPLWLGFHGSQQSEHALALIGSIVFSLAAILILGFLERRGGGLPEGRLGTVYVVAAAASILVLSKNPFGERGLLDLLKGEIITISNMDLILTAVVLFVIVGVLGLFGKELLMVSYDRVLAKTLGKRVVWWDVLLYLLIGLTVSIAVFSAGPLIAFGFLLIPVLAIHSFARNMWQLAVLSSLLGGTTAFIGFWMSYQWDLPVAPADVALLGIVYAVIFLTQKLIRIIKSSTTLTLK